MDTLAEQTKVGPRVVFHAINQIGLGHLSRLSAIALALRDRAPQVSTIILVDGSSHGLLEAVQLPYVGVSFSPTREGPGAFPDEPRSLLRQGFADHILSVLRPALLVFDSFPDPEFLRAARRRKISLALCLRKMRAPQFKRIHRMMGVFDTILLPHDRGEIEIPDELVPKSHFVGTIVRPLSTSRDDHAPDIVISGGGGGFPGPSSSITLLCRPSRIFAGTIRISLVFLSPGRCFRTGHSFTLSMVCRSCRSIPT
jgi:UDP-N-acetylglucosamine--N-acetylmuramyl-(pentapeptide) pyrophosphoryl-undecaprenol N-acetylglucosamine transferase